MDKNKDVVELNGDRKQLGEDESFLLGSCKRSDLRVWLAVQRNMVLWEVVCMFYVHFFSLWTIALFFFPFYFRGFPIFKLFLF